MLPRDEATVGRARGPPRRRCRPGLLVTGSVMWLQASLVALVTALVFWLPGALVMQGWGWRLGRLGQMAVAPLVTCGLFGGAALLRLTEVPLGRAYGPRRHAAGLGRRFPVAQEAGC